MTAVEKLLYYLPNSINMEFKEQIEQVLEMEKEQREKDLESGFHTGRLYQGREGDTTLEQLKSKTFKYE
jgi:hypothetical protein